MTKKTKQQKRGKRSTASGMRPLRSDQHPYTNGHSNHSSWSLTCEPDKDTSHHTEATSSTAHGQQSNTQQYQGNSGAGASGNGFSSAEMDALLFGVGSQFESKSKT